MVQEGLNLRRFSKPVDLNITFSWGHGNVFLEVTATFFRNFLQGVIDSSLGGYGIFLRRGAGFTATFCGGREFRGGHKQGFGEAMATFWGGHDNVFVGPRQHFLPPFLEGHGQRFFWEDHCQRFLRWPRQRFGLGLRETTDRIYEVHMAVFVQKFKYVERLELLQ